MTQRKTIGDKRIFAIEYAFFPDSHETELLMYINGSNILSFEHNGELFTTRWNLDELAMWLRKFINEMAEDPYPVNCDGEYAAQKDDNARDFDSEDEEEFEVYYQKLYEWNLRHRWHTASSGGILADVFFQKVSEYVEVSWDNRNLEKDVLFKHKCGGARIPKELFVSTVNAFLRDYAIYWFS